MRNLLQPFVGWAPDVLGVFILRVIFTIAAFVLSIVLARQLGVDEFGVYSVAYTVACVLAVLAEFGLSTLVTRETSVGLAKGNFGLVKRLWIWAGTRISVLSTFTVLLGYFIFSYWGEILYEKKYLDVILWSLLAVPVVVATNLIGGGLRGIGHVVLAMVPDQLFRPVLYLSFLLTACCLLSEVTMDARLAIFMWILAGFFSLLGSIRYLLKMMPFSFSHVVATETQRDWHGASASLALVGGISLINQYADILMLGALGLPSDVGLYRVSVQVSLLVAFGIQVVNAVVMPRFARLFAENDYDALQLLVTHTARIILLFTAPVAAVVLLFGENLIGIAFGAEYAASYNPTIILVVGQVLNAVIGSVAILLNMTGNERSVLFAVGLAAITNIILNIVLIPVFGATGAALATVAALAIWNFRLWYVVRSKLNVDTTAFGFFSSI